MERPFPHPSLSPLQVEALTILAEEASEVAQECSKMLRMGAGFCRRGRDVTTRTHLTTEIGDFLILATICDHLGLLDQNIDIDRLTDAKVARLREWSNLGEVAAEATAK